MSLYISPKNEYPRHVGDIQLEHPSYEIGQELPDGWIEVIRTDFPEISKQEVAYEDFPELKNDKYYQVWKTRPMTNDELLEASLQKIRNKVALRQPLTAEEAALLIG